MAGHRIRLVSFNVAAGATAVLMPLLVMAQVVAGQSAEKPVVRVTAADYARAERFLPWNTGPLVMDSIENPVWLDGNRFWYRTRTADGQQFRLANAATGKTEPAFDQAKLAAALSAAAGEKYAAGHLPFGVFEYGAHGRDEISFELKGARWTCDLKAAHCDSVVLKRSGGEPVSLSPNGLRAVFVRDFNLWLRENPSGKETKLTTDGVKDFGYATDNAGWNTSDRPIVAWSPDSKKVFTYQQDQRGVGEMYLVNTKVGHPELRAWKYPLPGDAVVTMIQRVVIDLDRGKVIRLRMEPDQHRSTLCDDISCRGGPLDDAQWSGDGSHVAFLSSTRDHKKATLRVAEAATGKVSDVFTEESATYYESGDYFINWKYLPDSKEVIWFSERDNWGQLYLYDLATGKLKNAITTGEGNVTGVTYIDEKARLIYFEGVGREAQGDPYFVHLYRVGFDGSGLQLLTPEEASHVVSLSPSGEYFIDSYSRPDVPPVTVLRGSDGRLIATLAKADISRLVASGWVPPVPFTVKARDGKTDLYGLMFKPSGWDEKKKYPIINHIYPGPQVGSVGARTFLASRGDSQALAELGFVVVSIDGMGTPLRSKTFHDAYFGDLGDNTLPDQVKGMRELAERYKWIDLERAGIYGHSGGGYATADAMFRYPDFFKVGVSESGNHDNRSYEDDWAEKWVGLLKKNADGTSNYDSQANQTLAKNLKGHLLLAHGTMDDNVPPYNTLLVVDELIKANKDFDLIFFPNAGHGYGAGSNYMMRRRWDYFVRYLLPGTPPEGYEIHGGNFH